jgi:hypothetical protein
MKLSDLTESPISDYYSVRLGDSDIRRGFDKKDQYLINSPHAKAKMVKAFSKTPHVFEVWMVDIDNVPQNINGAIDIMQAGIHDVYKYPENNYNIDTPQIEIAGEKGKIKVVMMGNISPQNKMPMTAWTLAHKIGHSFQDGWFSDNEIEKYVNTIDALMKLGSATEIKFTTSSEFINTMTMNSAQSGLLTNGFEAFPELVAQYLITGIVTIKDHPEKSQQLTTNMNSLFNAIDGKVIVEI